MSKPSSPAADALWTVADVAEFLRVSRSWVYQRAAIGDLPCLKIAGLLRFDAEAIRAVARGESHLRGRVVAMKAR